MEQTITFQDQELKLIHQLLEGDHSRLLLEIAHTDKRSMRHELQKREELLKSIVEKVRFAS